MAIQNDCMEIIQSQYQFDVRDPQGNGARRELKAIHLLYKRGIQKLWSSLCFSLYLTLENSCGICCLNYPEDWRFPIVATVVPRKMSSLFYDKIT